MGLFNRIYAESELFTINSSECYENEIGITYDPSLLDTHGEIDTDKVLILCIDGYYNTKRMPKPPKSIDCLIIIKCGKGYSLHLIELRNVSSMKGIKTKEILPKFETTIKQFLENDFKHIFMDESLLINDFKLYLITDACKIKKLLPDLTEDEYRKKIGDSALNIYQSTKPFMFRDIVAMITPCVPDHKIRAC